MDESQQLAKALVEAGLFKVLAIFCSGPIGVYLIGESIKWIAGKKRIERQEEMYRCQLFDDREKICQFKSGTVDKIESLKETVKEDSRTSREILHHIENLVENMKDDRRELKEMYKLIYEKISNANPINIKPY